MARKKEWRRYYGAQYGVGSWDYTTDTLWELVELTGSGSVDDTVIRTLIDARLVLDVPDAEAAGIPVPGPGVLQTFIYSAVVSSDDLTIPELLSFGDADDRINATGQLSLIGQARNATDTGTSYLYNLQDTIDSRGQRKSPDTTGYAVAQLYAQNILDPGLMGTGSAVSFQLEAFFRVLFEVNA